MASQVPAQAPDKKVLNFEGVVKILASKNYLEPNLTPVLGIEKNKRQLNPLYKPLTPLVFTVYFPEPIMPFFENSG